MDSILELKDVEQWFRSGFWLSRVQVLKGINLSVSEKSILGILGANGAGKTTLIHLMVGLRKPSKGRVRVFGKDASTIEAKSRIGYLPERPYFHEHLTGEGLLRYFGTLAGLSSTKIRDRIPIVLAAVGMKEARRIELKRYSKGMLQRIGIAQALIHNPEFLVLDEPMSGLDPLGRKEMRELILQLASEGRTLCFSSHVIPDVEAVCSQVVLLEKGSVIGSGPLSQFISDKRARTEVAFTGLKISDLKEWSELESLQTIPEGTKAVISGQEAVDSIIQKLHKNHAKVLWVVPMRPSLEEFFESPKEPK